MRKALFGRGLAGFRAGAALMVLLTLLAAIPAAAMVSPRLKPPAPGPSFASRQDYALLNEARRHLAQRNWRAAKASAASISDPIARSLAEWFYFYAEDPKVDIAEADAFLDAHPDWPAQAKIRSHVEKRMGDTTPERAVLDFFETRDPVTGAGKLQLARALFSAGERDAALLHVREAWVDHDFILSDEQKLLANYGGSLSHDDHAARVDRLLWDRQVTAARRVFSRLDSRHRRMAEARAALLLRAASGPALFYALPEDDRLDPGVLLAAVRYYRRSGEEPRAVALALQAPADPDLLRNPVRWWEERQLLMRWALKERQYKDAYALAAGHGLKPGAEFAEAEFNAGWIALRFLGAPERAETHFTALANAVGTPISLARAYYWLGRAAEAKGETQTASARYRVAASYAYTFYGQLAAERLQEERPATTFAQPVTPTPAEQARFASRPVVAALRILSELDDDQAFLTFAYHVDDELESPGEYVELARLAERKGATHVAVRAGKVGVGRGAFAAEVVYPLIFVPDEATRFAPAEIILGLSRQESEFNPRAYSRAGARGLMQLLPTTAQITARKEGLRYSRSALLDDPIYNLTIGSAHLSHLFRRFNGSRVMTFAAYNAGASRVDEWVERYGDPRSGDVDPVDWIEQIPFAETRNYVQRVLENTQVYRARLTAQPIAGKLAGDLEVGGPSKRAGLLAGRTFAETLPALPARTAIFAEAAALISPDAAAAAVAESTIAADDAMNASDIRIDSDAPAAIAQSDAQGGAEKKQQEKPGGKPSLTRLLGARPQSEPAPAGDQESAPLAEKTRIAQLADLSAGAPVETSAVNKGESDDCETYRSYIAETDREDASASDLNAGMLAELIGGSNCREAASGLAPEVAANAE